MPPINYFTLLRQLQYPAMTYVESQIFRSWLELHGRDYDAIEFNLRLGSGVDPGPSYSDSTRRMNVAVTQLRPDVVARLGSDVTLIEVKVRIGLPVIGQLIGYRELWRRQYPEQRVVRLLAIGRSAVADVGPVIQAQGIAIEVFPRADAREPV